MGVRWVFDPLPPSGKRRGGNAAEYTFQGRIDVLVREALQNSLDATGSERGPVRVVFRLIDLKGAEVREFLDAIDWTSLEDNLRAVPDKRGGRGIKRALDQLDETNSLRLLVIEDRGTRGLEGGEQRRDDQEKNSFCALVRDELYSDKMADDSGGSHGLGKSLLWAYSAMKTVLFASVPERPPEGKQGLRLIGRAALPYHETDNDGPSTGDGWLGIARSPDSAQRRAESAWGAEALSMAQRCMCGRDGEDRGLSVVVVGFTEPGEEDRGLADLMAAIETAALQSFWPAIVRQRLSVEIRWEEDREVVDRRQVDPSADAPYRPLVELLRAFDQGALEEKKRINTGEACVRRIPVEVPERTETPAHGPCSGSAAVLVRVLEEDDVYEPVRDRIFRFRGPGMVVRNERGRNLSIAARPYVAAVVVGVASGSGEVNERVERFLRAAEPPAHDEWTHNTRAVKQEYKAHGCRVIFSRFEDAILGAIRDLVSQPEQKGGALPASLLRYLRFGDRGGGGNPRFLSVTGSRAFAAEGSWTFQAKCRRVTASDVPWHVKVRLKYAVDGGGGEDVHAICEITSEQATRSEIRQGVGYLEFPAAAESAKIAGRTDAAALPTIGTRAAIKLRIDGAEGGIPDA